MRSFLRGIPLPRDVASDCRSEFVVQGVDKDGAAHPHILALEAASIVHIESNTRIAFNRHPYTDVDVLQCDPQDPLLFVLKYLNDAPYPFYIFGRDKARLTILLEGRVHLYSMLLRRIYGQYSQQQSALWAVIWIAMDMVTLKQRRLRQQLR